MKTIEVDRKQNIVDVCLQVYGTTQLLFQLAKDNNLAIDSDVAVGQVLVYNDTIGDKLVIEQSQRRNLIMINPINPVIAITDGIGVWKIGSTFTIT